MTVDAVVVAELAGDGEIHAGVVQIVRPADQYHARLAGAREHLQGFLAGSSYSLLNRSCTAWAAM